MDGGGKGINGEKKSLVEMEEKEGKEERREGGKGTIAFGCHDSVRL